MSTFLIVGPAQGYGTFSSYLTRGDVLISSVLPFGYNRAIDIAEKFTDAQVTAVDISPMLPRFSHFH